MMDHDGQTLKKIYGKQFAKKFFQQKARCFKNHSIKHLPMYRSNILPIDTN